MRTVAFLAFHPTGLSVLLSTQNPGLHMRSLINPLAALLLIGSTLSARTETAATPAAAVMQRATQLLQDEKVADAEKQFAEYYSTFPEPEKKEAVQASLKAAVALVAEQLDRQGLTLESSRRLDDAKAVFEKGLRLREQVFGKDYTGVAISLNNIGLILLDQAKYDAAEPILRDAISLREKLQGPNTGDLVAPLATLGGVLASEKRFNEAEAAFQKALTISRSVGGSARERAIVLRNLATLYSTEGKTDQAQSALLEASKLQSQTPR